MPKEGIWSADLLEGQKWDYYKEVEVFGKKSLPVRLVKCEKLPPVVSNSGNLQSEVFSTTYKFINTLEEASRRTKGGGGRRGGVGLILKMWQTQESITRNSASSLFWGSTAKRITTQYLRPQKKTFNSKTLIRGQCGKEKTKRGGGALTPSLLQDRHQLGAWDTHLGSGRLKTLGSSGAPHHDLMFLTRSMAAGLGAQPWRRGAPAATRSLVFPMAVQLESGATCRENSMGQGTPRQSCGGSPAAPASEGTGRGIPAPGKPCLETLFLPGLKNTRNPQTL